MVWLAKILMRCADECQTTANAAAEGSPRWTAESARAIAYRDAAARAQALADNAPFVATQAGGAR